MYLWREVSVDGDIYNLRKARSSTTRGDLVRDETNQLQVIFSLYTDLPLDD